MHQQVINDAFFIGAAQVLVAHEKAVGFFVKIAVKFIADGPGFTTVAECAEVFIAQFRAVGRGEGGAFKLNLGGRAGAAFVITDVDFAFVTSIRLPFGLI